MKKERKIKSFSKKIIGFAIFMCAMCCVFIKYLSARGKGVSQQLNAFEFIIQFKIIIIKLWQRRKHT